MPREIAACSWSLLTRLRLPAPSPVLRTFVLYQTHGRKQPSIFRGRRGFQRSSDLAGQACIRLLAYYPSATLPLRNWLFLKSALLLLSIGKKVKNKKTTTLFFSTFQRRSLEKNCNLAPKNHLRHSSYFCTICIPFLSRSPATPTFSIYFLQTCFPSGRRRRKQKYTKSY